MTRNQARTQFNNLLKMLDKRYVGSVYKALRLQVNDAIKIVKEKGPQAAHSELTITLFNRQIAPVILNIHSDAGVYMANKTLSALKKEKFQKKYRGFGHNAEWIADIQNYFSDYLLNKSVIPISKTTRDRLLEILNKGIEEGWGVDQIVREMNDLKELRYRAERIVRTETVRAANYGKFLGADKFDFEVQKEWISVNDRRTRDTHRANDGQIREVNERFGNNLLFPGDPSGPAKEVISCRCSMAFIPKRDAQGRLIPKKSATRVRPGGSLIEALSTGIALGVTLAGAFNSEE